MQSVQPRYQATYFPGLGCVFDAVTEDGKVHTIGGVGTARDWSVCECRRYALGAGFCCEATHRNETGQAVFHWSKPEAQPCA